MIMQRLAEARRRNQGGFTLVELLVVIAILGILAAIVLFNISGVNASTACNAMKTDGATIQSAADLYYNSKGCLPGCRRHRRHGQAGQLRWRCHHGAPDQQPVAPGAALDGSLHLRRQPGDHVLRQRHRPRRYHRRADYVLRLQLTDESSHPDGRPSGRPFRF